MGKRQDKTRVIHSVVSLLTFSAIIGVAWETYGVSPLLAQDDKPKILLSENPKAEGKEKLDLRLRPNTTKHPLYLFVNNPGQLDKKLFVELLANGAAVEGSRTEVTVAAGKTQMVTFG